MTSCPPKAEMERLLENQFACDDTIALEAHLVSCPRCRDLLDQLTDTPLAAVTPANTVLNRQHESDWRAGQEILEATLLKKLGEDSPPAEPLPLGGLPVVPGYQLEFRLGEGGAGIVYRARHDKLQRRVAVKMLRPGTLDSLAGRGRFRREAEILSRLRHPHIVQLLDFGEISTADGPATPYMVLELVEGGTLAEKVNRSAVPARTAAGLVEILARALHVVHQQGIIHRDLKPGNILLEATGGITAATSPTDLGRLLEQYVPRITDFGLAKELTADASPWTQTHDLLGTPAYMAPEQASGSQSLTPATDVYSLGVILYELMTGLPPFRSQDWVELIVQVKEQEPVTPSRLLPGLPRDLETICLKCLNKEPAQRYAGAEALADDLRRFLDGKAILARPAGLAEKFGKWCRRNPVVAGLVATVFALLVGGLAVTSALLVLAGRRQDETLAALAQVKTEEARTRDALDAERRRREQARLALEALTSELVPESFGQQATLTPDQRRFLTRALAMYQEFARDTATDEASRLGIARAQERIGQFQRMLGLFPEARASFDEARQSWEQLVAEFPATSAYRRSLAHVCWSQSVLLRDLGQPAEAETQVRSALSLNERLLAEIGPDPQTENQRCECINTLGTILRIAGRPSEAEEQFRTLIPLRRQLVERDPESVPYSTGLVLAHKNLAMILVREPSKRKEAEQHAQAAVAAAVTLAARHGSRNAASLVATCRSIHGSCLDSLGEVREAEAEYRAAAAILAALSRDYPGDPSIQRMHARTLIEHAKLLYRTDKFKEAEAAARAALSIREQLARRGDQGADDASVPAESQFLLGQIKERLGQDAEAETAFRTSVRLWRDLVARFPERKPYRGALAETEAALARFLARTADK